jgi:heme-degrading monooxygenase HmoA
MIRHIVFFGARDPASLDAIADGLALLRTIPGCRSFEVARNLKLDPGSEGVDVIVYAEFRTAEDLAAFKDHPAYKRATEIVRPLRGLRLVGDFASSGD